MMEFVNGKDDIPYMKWNIKFMFETTNQTTYFWGINMGYESEKNIRDVKSPIHNIPKWNIDVVKTMS